MVPGLSLRVCPLLRKCGRVKSLFASRLAASQLVVVSEIATCDDVVLHREAYSPAAVRDRVVWHVAHPVLRAVVDDVGA